ncbi:Uncharacterized protein dnl_05070 [Desulfonema limicola]|uniref:Uncharacterized protein n=1 Tax=Desulfonema limicola TaxID=45656 RepID=A0A975B3T2_9BACT|nr:Uncharacterized protein dnl_05070 [Desulfonema limicola]
MHFIKKSVDSSTVFLFELLQIPFNFFRVKPSQSVFRRKSFKPVVRVKPS